MCKNDLKQHIGYYSQNPSLYGESVKSNLIVSKCNPGWNLWYMLFKFVTNRVTLTSLKELETLNEMSNSVSYSFTMLPHCGLFEQLCQAVLTIGNYKTYSKVLNRILCLLERHRRPMKGKLLYLCFSITFPVAVNL